MGLPAIVLVLLMFVVATSVLAQRRSALDDEIAQAFYEGLGRQIGAALESAGAAARSLADANRDIQEARRRFWAEYDSGRRNGPAEAEFGRKLLAKDIVLMSLNVSGGTQGKTVLGLNALFGELDGGIPGPARTEFEEWITVIRYALGANGPNATVFATPAQLRSALEKTTQWYDVYRQWRDWAEFSAHGISRPRPTAESPGQAALVALRPPSLEGVECLPAGGDRGGPWIQHASMRLRADRRRWPRSVVDVPPLVREGSAHKSPDTGRGGGERAVPAENLPLRKFFAW